MILRDTYQKKKEAFWKMVAEKNIIPIHNAEVAGSSVPAAEAKNFHAGAPAPAPSNSAPSVSLPNSDELFDDMA